jgi:hypothetical protein
MLPHGYLKRQIGSKIQTAKVKKLLTSAVGINASAFATEAVSTAQSHRGN